MAVSAIGVGSNLPLEKLLEDLRKAESVPLELIEDKTTLANARLSAYGVLKSSVEALQTAAEALNRSTTFGAKKSTSSDAATIGVTSTNAAFAGQYSLTVSSLASSQSLVAQGVASRTEAQGTGGVITFTLAGGGTKTLDLKGQPASLDNVVKAINADPSLGLQASVINDGDPDAPQRLMLTASTTGTEAALSGVSVAGNATLAGILNFQAGEPPSGTMSEKKATNAAFTVNDIAITSQTNSVSDAIEGLTLTLTKTTTTPVEIKVTEDPSVTKAAIETFVSTYNSLNNTIRQMTAVDLSENTASVLTGDSVSRTIQSRLRGVLDSALPESTIKSLDDLGISSRVEGAISTLVIDNDKLNAALKNNMPGVMAVFTGEQGLAERMRTASFDILRTGGVINNAQEGMRRTIADLKDETTRVNTRIEASMERYRKQFVALDGMVAQMNSLSSYLTQQLSMLSSNNERN